MRLQKQRSTKRSEALNTEAPSSQCSRLEFSKRHVRHFIIDDLAYVNTGTGITITDGAVTYVTKLKRFHRIIPWLKYTNSENYFKRNKESQ